MAALGNAADRKPGGAGRGVAFRGHAVQLRKRKIIKTNRFLREKTMDEKKEFQVEEPVTEPAQETPAEEPVEEAPVEEPSAEQKVEDVEQRDEFSEPAEETQAEQRKASKKKKEKKKLTKEQKKKRTAKALIIVGSILLAFAIFISSCAIANAVGTKALIEQGSQVAKVEYTEHTQLIPTKDADGYYSFTKPDDGREFKIVQLTDVHIGGG